jgi:hypothetical protein
MHPPCFPAEVHVQHGCFSLHRVPCRGSPFSLLLSFLRHPRPHPPPLCSPLAAAYSFWPPCDAHGRRARGSGSGLRLPAAPVEKDAGFPRYWVTLFVVAAVIHPARCASPVSPLAMLTAWRCCLRGPRADRHREGTSFGVSYSAAPSFACLRIADPLTEIVARLATGRLARPCRVGFAPTGWRLRISSVHRF